MDSLKVTDQAAQAVAVAPRVTLEQIRAAVKYCHEFTAGEAIDAMALRDGGVAGSPPGQLYANAPEHLLSICILVLHNGFTVVGKSAPASPENFNAKLGHEFAYEDAIRQLWPLMGFALRDKLAAG